MKKVSISEGNRRRNRGHPSVLLVVSGRGRDRTFGRPPEIRTCRVTASALTSGVWHRSLKVDLVLFPCHAVDSRCCHTLERAKALSKCPGRGSLRRVALSRSSFLHSLRRRQGAAVVREFLRYYTTVRLPTDVHAGRAVLDLLRPTWRPIAARCPWDLPFPACMRPTDPIFGSLVSLAGIFRFPNVFPSKVMVRSEQWWRRLLSDRPSGTRASRPPAAIATPYPQLHPVSKTTGEDNFPWTS